MAQQNLKTIVIALFIVLTVQIVQGQKSQLTEQELIEKAQDFFKDDNWKEALPLYAQLVSVYPDNAEYNYRLGVCSLFGTRTNSDRPIRYLNKAFYAMPENKELMYYLGLAYYQDHKFSSAQFYFENYLKIMEIGSQERALIEEKIRACERGLDLLHINQMDEVIVKAEYQKDNFHRAYPIDEFDGSLIKKPKDFSTDRELKSGSQSFVYISEPRGVLYYSGYMDEKTRHRDIFKVSLNEKGTWGTPEKLSEVVNSSFDEDYPVMTNDGATLYFSSKGHNSMGGYDVFRSTYDATSGKFGKPENMGIGINSPFDDILFIPDNSGHGAYFASTRENQEEDITVFKVRLTEGLSPEEKLIAQNAGSGLNLPPKEEPIYLSYIRRENSTDSTTEDLLTETKNPIVQTNDRPEIRQNAGQEMITEATTTASVTSHTDNNGSNESNIDTSTAELAMSNTPETEEKFIVQNSEQGQSLNNADQSDSSNTSIAENSNDAKGGTLLTQTDASTEVQKATMEDQTHSIKGTGQEAGSGIQYAAVVRSESALTSNGQHNPGTEIDEPAMINEPGAHTGTTTALTPAKGTISTKAALAQGQVGQQKNTTAKTDKETNGLTLSWEVIYTEDDPLAKSSPVKSRTTMSPVKQVEAVSYNNHTMLPIDDEPLFVTIESDPIKKVQLVKYSAAQSTWPDDESALDIILEEKPSQQVESVHYVNNPWAGFEDDPSLEITTESDLTNQVEIVEFAASHGMIEDESLEISMASDPIKAIQVIKYAEAQTRGMEEDEILEIVPVNGTTFNAQPMEYAANGWGFEAEDNSDQHITEKNDQGNSPDEPTYALSFKSDDNGISSLTASESGLLSLPEPISVPMPLDDADAYAELIRLALTDPDQLTYDELLFAASLVDQPDDKLKIYYASFIRSERDWRAYYNASVAAQTTADAEKAAVYRYQASLIYTEELVGQLSPGMMLKLR